MGDDGEGLKPRFRRKGDSIIVNLPAEERGVLAQVLDLLADVERVEDDPAYRRLKVPVYLDDAEANEEWWRLMGDELDQSRAHDRAVYRGLMETNDRVVLSDAEGDAVLRVLNEGRLAFAARLKLEVEEDHDQLPEADRAALDFLGWILEDLTVVLMQGL